MKLLNIVVLALLFAPCLTPVEAAGDSDRQAMQAAWQQYSELYRKGKYSRSLDAVRRVYDLAAQKFPDDERQLAIATFSYGDNLLRVNEYEESRAMLQLAVERYEQAYGDNSLELVPVLLALAETDALQRWYRPIRRHLKRSRIIVAANLDPESVPYADRLLAIGRVALLAGDDDDIREALSVYRSALGEEHLKTGAAAMALGQYHLIEGNRDEAVEFLSQSLKIFDPDTEEGRKAAVVAHGLMVRLLEDNGERQAATEHCLAVGRLQAGQEPVASPTPLRRVAPRYPRSALRDRVSGSVTLGFTIDEAGFVVDPELIAFEGAELFVAPAIAATEQFRYAPRFENGQPVRQEGITTKITFRLEN